MAKKPADAHDAVPEYKIFKDHYHGLTKLLFNTNLTPHLIQEGIIAPADQEKLSAIDTSAGKAEMVLPKITSALEAGITDSFYKMLGIMRSYGNHDAQQLSITMKHEIAGSKNDKEPVPVIDDLSLDFSAMVADVAEILHKSPTILNKLKLVCYSITTTEKSLVFSEKESAAIRASPSVFDVFYELRDHWRWDSHRLLFTLIKRSGSRDAMEKLRQFQNKINYMKKLNEFTEYYQSVQKPPPDGYTRMIAIIDKDYSEFTVKECEELDEYLGDSFGSAALNPAIYERHDSIKVTWYIPTEAVSGVLSRAYQAKELFQLFSILYFEIDEIVIWNVKSSYSLQALKTQQQEVIKMKQEVVELTAKIDQCNVKLKTAHEDIAAKKKANKKLQESLKKVKDEADKVPKLQEQIQELSAKVTQSEDKEKSLDEEMKKNKSELEGKKKEIDELHEKLKVMRSARNDLIKDLDAKNTELSDMMTKAKEHLDKIIAEKEKLEVEYAKFQTSNAGTQTSKDELINELQAKNAELSTARDKNKEQVDSIQQDLDKATAERNRLESECSKLQGINAEMKSNEQKLVEEIEKKTKEISRVQEELLQKINQPESLPTSLPTESVNNPTQGKIIQRLREQVRSLTDGKASLTNENHDLIQERNKLIDQIKLLQQPKEFDSGIGVSIPGLGSKRSLDSGIALSRPTTGEQPYVPGDKKDAP